jgi:hypothetical protein
MHTAEVSTLRSRLWDAGFRPVAVLSRDKRPLAREWGESARQDPPECVRLGAVPHALNTGILCDGLRAVDFDIDDDGVAGQCRDLAVSMLGDAPCRWRRNSARFLALYRAADGAPRKIVLAGRLGKIEVLGLGQQFVAFGWHPSGAELEWLPEAPGDVALADLPVVTEVQLRAFLAACAPLIGAEAPSYENGEDHAPASPQADPLRVAAALNVIPNGGEPADWEAWNRIGMAAWAATGGSDLGFAAFDAWSGRHPAYDAVETRGRWEHYRGSPPTKIGAGTLFRLAKQAWEMREPEEAPEPQPEPEPVQEPPPAPDDGQPPVLTLRQGFAAAEALPAQTVVQGILYRRSVTLFYGAPKSGKSFLTTDLALAVAAGWDSWMGHRILVNGPVLYVACEGHAGFWKRLRAAAAHYGWTSRTFPRDFVLATGRPALICADSMGRVFAPNPDAILAALADLKARGVTPVAIIIDTVFRSFGSGNVNASDHMNAYLATLSQIADRGIAVAAVHHEIKSGGTPAGSVSLIAGSDSVIHVWRDEATRYWQIEYAKDDAETDPHSFDLEVIDLGVDPEGQPASSCVVIEGATGQRGAVLGRKLSPAEAVGVRSLKIALGKAGALLPPLPDYPASTVAVAASVWRAEFYQLNGGTAEGNKKAFQRAAARLLAATLITQRDDLVWLVSRDAERDS